MGGNTAYTIRNPRMNQNLISSIIGGASGGGLLLINNAISSLKDKKKEYRELKAAADKTQMEFANTLREELRKANEELTKEIEDNKNKIDGLIEARRKDAEAYSLLNSSYIALMEQHSELKMQYAAAISRENDLTVKYEQSLKDLKNHEIRFTEVQGKYEALLSEVSELRGIVKEGIINEVQI